MMRNLVLAALGCLCPVAPLACGGRAPAHAPSAARIDLPKAFERAFVVDETGDARVAVPAYLALVHAAAADGGNRWQVPALAASLDALVTRTMPALESAAQDAALAWRTSDIAAIAQGLSVAERDARGPFARALVARARMVLAERRGDAAGAALERAASGCAREAVVLGPTDWAPITGVEDAGATDRADLPLQASYPTGDPFGTVAHPLAVGGLGCSLPLSVESARAGVREVLVDVDVPRPERLGVVLRAHGAAVLTAGGSVVLRRPFELGDGQAARLARVDVSAGTLRIDVRVGTAKEDDTVEIDVLDEDGRPLPTHAPAIGSRAEARVTRAQMVTSASAADLASDEALLSAAAALAQGAPRTAEEMLEGSAMRPGEAPELALLYGRAVESASDLSPATRAERARSAYERVLEARPKSWEAAIAHAVLAGVRRGRDEAGAETLRDLDEARSKVGDSPLLDAFDALRSGQERLMDRARAALDRARPALANTALFGDAEDAASSYSGSDLSERACRPDRPTTHDSLACHDALRAEGRRMAAEKETERLRALRGAPRALLAVELREALADDDREAAVRAFGAMLPADRTLAERSLLDDSPDLVGRLLRAAPSARDAPGAIGPLLRAEGDGAAGQLDDEAARLAALDRASSAAASAPTVILEHRERYDLQPSGLLHWTLFDVRRVRSTTDVQENAQAATAMVWGRSVVRPLRRRILKEDGRILEPDRAPRASQADADLSQLEPGDVVEALYEGWALPGDTGDIGIDTPDLLPDRTAVRDATIELRLPRALQGALFSHPELGAPSERVDGSSRVLTWHVVDHPVRPIEDGVPRMDRSASVSFSTMRWERVARALRETIAALDEHDPAVADWARAAAQASGARPNKETVQAIVHAAGEAIHEADPGVLSDYGGGIALVQSRTARTFLASHEGSRSWLVLRALRELGVPCDLVVAENDPYSADPRFPPHFGRFLHPLVVAHVEGKDVWVDADVEGPPLPAGRVSPELRGRLALRADGHIEPLPAFDGEDNRDEVDIRLALDGRGNARGTFAVVLRSREAQELSEALTRIVGAERQHALREVVLAWMPWADVDHVELSSSEGSWQVALRADVAVSGYAQPEGGKTWLLPGLETLHWAWPRARVSSLAAAFATRADRGSALALSTAVQYHVRRRVELPAGAVVASMPGPLDLETKLVQASRKIAVDSGGEGRGRTAGGAILDDFVLGVATGTVAKDDYEGFVKVAHQADDAFASSVRVSVPR